MEYTRLPNLSNTYPNFKNYKVNGENTVQLIGIYPEKNKLDFKIPSLDELQFVTGTNFRFILAIFKTWSDTSPKYYTSDVYYKDLEASVIENNPYFLQNSFKNENIVSYVCEDTLTKHKEQTELEVKSFVNIRQSLFIKGTDDIDYDNLVTYIDWFVDKPSPLDDDNYGVLKPEVIAGWDVLNGNYVTGKLSNGVSGSFGIGTPTPPTNEVNVSDAEGNLKLAKDKLNKISADIDALETAIKNETGFQYDRVLLGIFYKKAYANINEKTYETNTSITRNKNEKTNQLKDIIRTSLNTKYVDKKTTESLVTSAQSSLTDLIKNVNEAAGIYNQAKDLLGKIPKIPKLPKLPKIPKLPKSLAALKGLLPALPLLPVLPKLPPLPKIPSLKFPPVPKFKPKTPKEPKKFKKGKGLKGLKDAAGDLQNQAKVAAASVQGAVSSAQSAVASAQSSIQSAAASAQSAVANAQSTIQNSVSTLQNTAQSAVASAQSVASSAVSSIQNEAQKAIASLSQEDIISQKNAQIQSGKRTAKTQKDGTIRYIYNDPSSPTGYVYGDGTIVNKDD